MPEGCEMGKPPGVVPELPSPDLSSLAMKCDIRNSFLWIYA